jgi:hypothetical protein
MNMLLSREKAKVTATAATITMKQRELGSII